MAEHQVLFCPFCRESHEGRTLCPEHELALVTFDKLAPDALDEPHDGELDAARRSALDEPLSAWSPRHGRGFVAVGALLVGLSLVLDFVRFDAAPALRTFELAHGRPSLWTLGLVSFTALYALARRRSLAELRGLRVVMPLLACAPLVTIGLQLQRGVASHGALGSAVYAVVLGSLLLLWGSLRLGR